MLFVAVLNAQQQPVVSPQIGDDHTVTFRLWAPDAQQVKIIGEFSEKPWKATDMEKGTDGIWSHTTPPLESDLFSYKFLVDGVAMLDPGNLNVLRDAMNLNSFFIVGGGKGDVYHVQDVAHGTVAFRWYDAKALGKTRRLSVYTPPGYESSKESYPILYLLHGVGGDETAWLELGRAAKILDNLIASKQIRPMIVVMTNGHTATTAAPGESSVAYTPQFGGPDVFTGQFEDSFGEVMAFVESNYRVKKEKASRAIAGLSMGGFHTLYISANYANMFDYVGLFSAATIEPKNPDTNIYKGLDDKLALQKQNGYKLYWMGMGKTDFLYKDFQNFKSRLDALDFKYTYRESEGGHTWSNWRVYLTEFLPLLFR